MSAASQQALEAHWTKAAGQLELHLRPYMKQEYECSARCASDMTLSSEAFVHCVGECGSQLNNFRQVYMAESEQFQNRFTRSVMQCEDRIRSQNNLTARDPIPQSLHPALIQCVDKCAEEARSQIDPFFARLRETLAKQR
eukprot:m.33810 g.33810  ORF g.33810 m.33810 type:complete len:140 (-) comp11057_c0_seq1:493-912(-)